MALALAVQHWRPYLLGRKFRVFSDQKSLAYLLQQRITTPDQQNWVAKLLGYHFEVYYKPGSQNSAADTLSCTDMGTYNYLLSFPAWDDEYHLVQEANQDLAIQKIRSAMLQEPISKPGFTLRNGILYYKDRLVISSTSKFIPHMLQEFHDTKTGGHSGYYRTYRRLAANLYWVGMTFTVQKYVQDCTICQQSKHSTLAPGGLLQPLAIPDFLWEQVSMDFISGLLRSKGYDTIFVVVDRLSKYSHLLLLKHPYTARNVAEIFVKDIVRFHGFPKSILSDRDPIFMSKFWKELFCMQGTELHMSSSYHPESDGQTKVINRCLETYLHCFALEQPCQWFTWIHGQNFGITPVSTHPLAPPLLRWCMEENLPP